MNQLQGYRTFIVSGIAILVAVAGFILNVSANLGPIDAKASVSTIGMAVLMAVLRTVTTTPPGKPKPEPVASQSTADIVDQVYLLLKQRGQINALLADIVRAVESPPMLTIMPPNGPSSVVGSFTVQGPETPPAPVPAPVAPSTETPVAPV